MFFETGSAGLLSPGMDLFCDGERITKIRHLGIGRRGFDYDGHAYRWRIGGMWTMVLMEDGREVGHLVFRSRSRRSFDIVFDDFFLRFKRPSFWNFQFVIEDEDGREIGTMDRPGRFNRHVWNLETVDPVPIPMAAFAIMQAALCARG